MIDVDQARLLLRIDESELSDDEIQKYIDHFRLVILAKLGEIGKDNNIEDTPLFTEALIAAIACQLSLTDIGMIHSPSSYKVGDTSEDYDNSGAGLYGDIPSWCSRYDDLLENIMDMNAEVKDIQIFRRRGMSSNRRWYRDF